MGAGADIGREMMNDKKMQLILLDEGIDPNKLDKEDLKRLLGKEAYESYRGGNEYFWHRGQEYKIGPDISLVAATMICLAQWIDSPYRLWFAHALFEKYMESKKKRPWQIW